MSDQLAGQLLWEPSPERIQDAGISAFIQWVNAHYGTALEGYQDLWQWSVDDIAQFWEAVRQCYGIEFSGAYDAVLENPVMPEARWYDGARLNLAQYLLRQGELADLNRVAIFAESECFPPSSVSWRELREQVARFASFLRSQGVGPGDHVAAYLPISIESVVALLGAISVGAVWSSCSPDFGAKSVLERFSQVAPKVLVAASGYRYNGKAFDRQADLADIIDQLPSLQNLVYLPWLYDETPQVPEGVELANWAAALDNDASYENLQFEQVDFAHPLWVLYTSGTTGLPKGIVHSQGGILLEFTKFGWLHDDLKSDSVKFFFTTTGWTMFNLLVGGFATGSAIVVYDGCPSYPDYSRLWEMAARLGITYFGANPTYFNALANKQYCPREHFDLQKIQTIATTGSPVSPENFAWIYQNVDSDIHVVSMSGGTDVAAAFVGGVSILPVHAGEIQVPCLGVDVCVFDEEGRQVIDEDGELVVRQPMPSMPIYFWNDPDRQRYLGSYFDVYPGVWRQGDQARFNQRMGCVISGRSDATLNRYGVRIGTAEIYRNVESIPGIADSLIVNLELPGARFFMPLFITLEEGVELDDNLRQSIREALARNCSPRHVPDEIHVVEAIPYTLSGKKQEIPVKKLLLGVPAEKAVKLEASANPEAIGFFVEFASRVPADRAWGKNVT